MKNEKMRSGYDVQLLLIFSFSHFLIIAFFIIAFFILHFLTFSPF